MSCRQILASVTGLGTELPQCPRLLAVGVVLKSKGTFLTLLCLFLTRGLIQTVAVLNVSGARIIENALSVSLHLLLSPWVTKV